MMGVWVTNKRRSKYRNIYLKECFKTSINFFMRMFIILKGFALYFAIYSGIFLRSLMIKNRKIHGS